MNVSLIAACAASLALCHGMLAAQAPASASPRLPANLPFGNSANWYPFGAGPIGFALRLVHPAGAHDWPEAETKRVAVHKR